MDKKIKQAYEALVPADQLVIDAMIVSLFKKDKQIHDCVKEISKRLEQEKSK